MLASTSSVATAPEVAVEMNWIASTASSSLSGSPSLLCSRTRSLALMLPVLLSSKSSKMERMTRISAGETSTIVPSGRMLPRCRRDG